MQHNLNGPGICKVCGKRVEVSHTISGVGLKDGVYCERHCLDCQGLGKK